MRILTDDAEFVALQKTIGAAGILSKDPHISMIGGNQVSLACIFRLRNYSRIAAIEMSIKWRAPTHHGTVWVFRPIVTTDSGLS